MPELHTTYYPPDEGYVLLGFIGSEFHKLWRQMFVMAVLVDIGTILFHITVLIGCILVLVFTFRSYLYIFTGMTIVWACFACVTIIAVIFNAISNILKRGFQFEFTKKYGFVLLTRICMFHVALLALLQIIWLCICSVIVLAFIAGISSISDTPESSVLYLFHVIIVCVNWIVNGLGMCYAAFFVGSFAHVVFKVCTRIMDEPDPEAGEN